jgi:hypothetical protein
MQDVKQTKEATPEETYYEVSFEDVVKNRRTPATIAQASHIINGDVVEGDTFGKPKNNQRS